VETVQAHGKHLYLHLTDGRVLRSHLGLYGSWHRYKCGERWRKPRRQATIRLETDDWDYVCFNAKHVEWLQADGFRLADQRARLGADLISEPQAPAEALKRARRLLAPSAPLVDLLLDQRIAAGIGNVYKSEVLFLESCWPLLPVEALSDDGLTRLFQRAADLLAANLGGGPRTTRMARDRRGQLWVYGRREQSCLRCGKGSIRRALLGKAPRSTYWCPCCQPVGEGVGDGAGARAR